MTIKLFNVLSLVAVGLSVLAAVSAQDVRLAAAAGDKYVISAKAGGVNYTEGRVVIARHEGKSGQLMKGDDIQIGDTVATGTDGRAEILLNPGSYMRVDTETEFSFLSTALDDLKLKLNSGSAIFEVIADDDFKVSVQTPKTLVDLTRSGVYRIDVTADGGAKVSVTKGAAFVGNEKAQVKAGRFATVGDGAAAIAKFDRDERDSLDTWSRDRAKELTKINSGLQRTALRNSLLSSFGQNGWNMYDSFGLWIFDPFRTSWCFMPFGYGWGSPYGFGYGYDFWRIGMPQWIYYTPPPVYRGSPPSTTTTTPTGPLAGTVTPPTRRPPTSPGTERSVPTRGRPENGGTTGRVFTPPYRRIETSERGSGDTVVPRRMDFPRSADSPSMPSGSTPTSSMPTSSGGGSGSSVPIRSAPTPVREASPRDAVPVRGKPTDN